MTFVLRLQLFYAAILAYTVFFCFFCRQRLCIRRRHGTQPHRQRPTIKNRNNMTEEEKCMAGILYDCHDESFIKRKARATQWCEHYAMPAGGVPARKIKDIDNTEK